MCLGTFNPEIQVANGIIPVFKILRMDNKSLVMNFQYEPRERYTLTSSLRASPNPIIEDYWLVNEGFHTYHSMKRARDERYCLSSSFVFKLVAFAIPKGTHYIIGDDGDIVSDTIVSGDLDDLGLTLESE